MGSRKLSEIRTEIRDAFAQKGIDVETWLDRQMAKVQRGPLPEPGVEESLRLVCNALRTTAARKGSHRKGRRRATNKA